MMSGAILFKYGRLLQPKLINSAAHPVIRYFLLYALPPPTSLGSSVSWFSWQHYCCCSFVSRWTTFRHTIWKIHMFEGRTPRQIPATNQYVKWLESHPLASFSLMGVRGFRNGTIELHTIERINAHNYALTTPWSILPLIVRESKGAASDGIYLRNNALLPGWWVVRFDLEKHEASRKQR